MGKIMVWAYVKLLISPSQPPEVGGNFSLTFIKSSRAFLGKTNESAELSLRPDPQMFLTLELMPIQHKINCQLLAVFPPVTCTSDFCFL